jgi:hypothetical protein
MDERGATSYTEFLTHMLTHTHMHMMTVSYSWKITCVFIYTVGKLENSVISVVV